jgi:hypothetical protein
MKGEPMNKTEVKAPYTKGPWNINPGGSCGVYGDGGGRLICGTNIVGDLPENEANARLIAAAPALVEELKSFVSWVKEHHPIEYERQIRNAEAVLRAAGVQP